MRLNLPLDFANLEEFSEFKRFVGAALKSVVDLVNGQIAFNENIKSSVVSVTFAANTTQAIAHGLNAVPNGYIVVKRSADITVFDGSGAPNTTTIFLQASAAGTVSLLFF